METTLTAPQFTIVTPSYNYHDYIRECLESVASQEGVTFEHLIFDAGSTDGTLDIIREYPHAKLTVEPDKGMSDAINKGFKAARGKWVMWLNTDDRLLPGALKKVWDFAEQHPEADVVHGAWNFVRKDGSYIRTIKAIPYHFMAIVHRGCYIASTALFLRRETTIDEGFLLNIRYRYVMDGEFYARLGKAKKTFVSLNIPLADFRLHDAQLSAAGTQDCASLGIDGDVDAALTNAQREAEPVSIRRAYGITPFKAFHLRALNAVSDCFLNYYYLVRLNIVKRLFVRNRP